MSLHHSEDTHRNLVDRVPTATGRQLSEWYQLMEAGPSMARFEDRVNWLRDEYGLAHGHATAIVHEQALIRAQRSFD